MSQHKFSGFLKLKDHGRSKFTVNRSKMDK